MYIIHLFTNGVYIYVLVDDGDEWEDMSFYVTQEEAIAISIKHPAGRLEIFAKRISPKSGICSYHPTYNYYRNGTYVETHTQSSVNVNNTCR